MLIERACDIARENGYTAINVISAIGTRGYYRKQGFTDNGAVPATQPIRRKAGIDAFVLQDRCL